MRCKNITMLRNSFIPYEHDGEVMIVVVADPENEQLLEIIGRNVSYDISFMVGIADDINDMIKEYYDDSLTKPDLDLPDAEKLQQEAAHDIIEDRIIADETKD
jgi:hypothetical protein